MENKYTNRSYYNRFGWTLAHFSAINGDTEKLKDCKRADLEAKDNIGMTPVHYAAETGHTETLKYLIEEAKVDVNVIDDYGRTPLDLVNDLESRGYKMEEIKNLLIRNGAKTDEELKKSLFRLVPLGRDGRVCKIGEEKKQKVVLKLVPLGRAGRPCDDGNKGPSR